MGIFKKKIVKKTYDREHMKPVFQDGETLFHAIWCQCE